MAGVSSTIVTLTLRLYQNGGLDAVAVVTHRKPRSALESNFKAVLEHFENKPPSTAKEAKDVIERLTGIKRNVSRIKVFLHKQG